MSSRTKLLNGSCHCGDLRFVFHTNQSESEFTPRLCQCLFCIRHDAKWITDPEGTVEITYREPTTVSFYSFGTRTADFIICRNCGVLVAAVSEIDGTRYAALNSKSMVEHSFNVQALLSDFDGESLEERLDRRKRNWIKRVTLTALGSISTMPATETLIDQAKIS